MHTLCQSPANDPVKCVEDAHALHCEFFEWLDPDIEDHEIYSLDYLGEHND
tara:strand:+ start:530 stop:682 length:153 start_codon:yes stop_codon:yes gene_type:complete